MRKIIRVKRVQAENIGAGWYRAVVLNLWAMTLNDPFTRVA